MDILTPLSPHYVPFRSHFVRLCSTASGEWAKRNMNFSFKLFSKVNTNITKRFIAIIVKKRSNWKEIKLSERQQQCFPIIKPRFDKQNMNSRLDTMFPELSSSTERANNAPQLLATKAEIICRGIQSLYSRLRVPGGLFSRRPARKITMRLRAFIEHKTWIIILRIDWARMGEQHTLEKVKNGTSFWNRTHGIA